VVPPNSRSGVTVRNNTDARKCLWEKWFSDTRAQEAAHKATTNGSWVDYRMKSLTPRHQRRPTAGRGSVQWSVVHLALVPENRDGFHQAGSLGL
jgi:hypothetical protein